MAQRNAPSAHRRRRTTLEAGILENRTLLNADLPAALDPPANGGAEEPTQVPLHVLIQLNDLMMIATQQGMLGGFMIPTPELTAWIEEFGDQDEWDIEEVYNPTTTDVLFVGQGLPPLYHTPAGVPLVPIDDLYHVPEEIDVIFSEMPNYMDDYLLDLILTLPPGQPAPSPFPAAPPPPSAPVPATPSNIQ